jgi:hypothetical protein
MLCCSFSVSDHIYWGYLRSHINFAIKPKKNWSSNKLDHSSKKNLTKGLATSLWQHLVDIVYKITNAFFVLKECQTILSRLKDIHTHKIQYLYTLVNYTEYFFNYCELFKQTKNYLSLNWPLNHHVFLAWCAYLYFFLEIIRMYHIIERIL